MKIAHIPPVSLLQWARKSTYHLMLPQLMTNKRYAKFFRELCCDPAQYVILDNGPAEGYIASPTEMVRLAECYGPDEIVLPDIIGDSNGTIKAIEKFIRQYDFELECRVGFVAAGQNEQDAIWTAKEVLDRLGDNIDVVYIPRMLVRPGMLHARLVVADAVRNTCDKAIHFLGTNPIWVKETLYAAASGMVRGIDTSAAFNYAFYDTDVSQNVPRKRPSEYFDRSQKEFDNKMLERNVATLTGWAHGIDRA